MSSLEAARQAGLLALGRIAGSTDAATRMRATGLRATFDRFAELDRPVTVRARPPTTRSPRRLSRYENVRW